MSSITTLSVGHQPTSIKGLHVKDAPLGVIEEMQQMSADEDADQADIVLFMFKNLLCGEDGTDFEDVNTVEDVSRLGVMTMKTIMMAAKEALDVEGKD